MNEHTDRLSVPQGTFVLHRYPVSPRERMRAWDAADELLLHALADPDTATSPNETDETGDEPTEPTPPVDLSGTVVILNDGFGALTTALATHHPHLLSDSYLAHAATRHNLAVNGADPSTVTFLRSFDPLPQHIDVLLVKVPKNLALLEDQLHRLAPTLDPRTVVIGAGMVKHVHTSTLDAFERIVGATHTSRARKKARLIFSTPAASLARPVNPWPTTTTLSPGGEVVVSHAGVFAAERLDMGTRFLVDHLPRRSGPEQVIDLGCGNGILGTIYALDHPQAEVRFVDESCRAVASAEATFRANLGGDRPAAFVWGDGVFDPADGEPPERGSIDLVLNNPPFHADHAVSDATAWRMFSEARDALRVGGELWVVGNRHLAYHAKLKRLFGNCTVEASNAKFVVLRATRAPSGPTFVN